MTNSFRKSSHFNFCVSLLSQVLNFWAENWDDYKASFISVTVLHQKLEFTWLQVGYSPVVDCLNYVFILKEAFFVQIFSAQNII